MTRGKTRYEQECEEYDKAVEERSPCRVIIAAKGPFRMFKAGEEPPKRNVDAWEWRVSREDE